MSEGFKNKVPGRKARAPSDLPIDFFASRWINRYIIQSITLRGDMSEAYELLLQDAHPQLKKQLKNCHHKKSY